jgi:hypothetical protein
MFVDKKYSFATGTIITSIFILTLGNVMKTLKCRSIGRFILPIGCFALMTGQLFAIPSDLSYRIVNVKSQKVLQPSSNNQGANVIQMPFSGSTAQLWHFVSIDDDEFYIVNNKTGLYMDISGASTNLGASNIVWTGNSQNNQRWVMTKTSDGFFYNIMNRNSGLYLDISGALTADGAQDIQWSSNGGDNQKWTIIASVDTSKTYKIYNQNSSKYLSPYYRCTQGENVVQYESRGNNLWKFQWAGNDYYYIMNSYTGNGKLFMDIYGASTSPGANNIIWSFNGNDNQKWKILPKGEDNFNIQNKNSGLFLDITGASTEEGAQDIQWAPNGGWNQTWRILAN